MARRGRNEGSIYQRSDGLYSGQLTLPSGKRWTCYGKTKAEVLNKLDERRAMGGFEPSRTTLQQYLESWLERREIRPATKASYATTLSHVYAAIGHVPLADLKTDHVVGLLADLDKAGIGARTRQLVRVVLGTALKDATTGSCPLLQKNPADGVKLPRVIKADKTPWTAEQVQAFCAAAKSLRIEAVYLLALGTCMRQGEILGLQWSDLDLDAGTVTVSKQLVEVGGKIIGLAQTKTKASNRSLALPQQVVAALRRRRVAAMAEGNVASPWVFLSRDGKPLHKAYVLTTLKRVAKRIGLPVITFHALRHTSGTMLLQAGADLVEIQKQMGHSSYSTTANIYLHSNPAMQRRNADRLQGLLGDA